MSLAAVDSGNRRTNSVAEVATKIENAHQQELVLFDEGRAVVVTWSGGFFLWWSFSCGTGGCTTTLLEGQEVSGRYQTKGEEQCEEQGLRGSALAIPIGMKKELARRGAIFISSKTIFFKEEEASPTFSISKTVETTGQKYTATPRPTSTTNHGGHLKQTKAALHSYSHTADTHHRHRLV